MNEIEECIFCHSLLEKKAPYGDSNNTISYICPTCGVYTKNYYDFQLIQYEIEDVEVLYSKIASFLYYNKNDYKSFMNNKRYFIGKEQSMNIFKEITSKIGSYTGTFLLVNEECINSFYPNKLIQKETILLKDIYKRQETSTHISEYSINEIESAAFIIHRSCWETNYAQYMELLNDLVEEDKIEILNDGKTHQQVIIKLTTKGIKTVEEGENSMKKEIKTSERTINIGPGATYVERVSGDNNIIGNTNQSGIDFNQILLLVDKIYSICNENEDKGLSSEVIESINDNLSDIREYVTQKNSNGILKRFKTIKGLLQSAVISIAANLLTPEIQTMIDQIKVCIGA